MIDTSLPPSAENLSEAGFLPQRSFGRMLRSISGYSLLTALMIVTPMLVFVPAALMHCALKNGRRASWMAGIVAVTLAFLYVGMVPSANAETMKMAWTYVAAVALAVALPAMTALPLVERGESFGRLLVFLLIGSAIGLAITETGAQAFIHYSPFAAQVAQAKQTSAEFIHLYRTKGMPNEVVDLAERWISYSTFVLPAVIMINMSLVFILSLLMLGRLKAWRDFAARKVESPGAFLFRNLSLPDWLLFGFILGGLTPLATGMLQKVSANVLALVAFLYILQGLAIFRFFLAAMGAGFAVTMLGWCLLAFLTITGVGPLLLGVAGLFDPFFDFRHFKKRKDDSHESHSD
jgi:uncharacterized protein YybS (DUF2232 family)